VSELVAPKGGILVATGILDRTHLRFFSPSTAAQLVRDAGLEIATEGGVVSFPSHLAGLGQPA
jgi:hypothetical protein